MTVGVFANAASAVLGRSVNRKSHLIPIVITVISMGIGSTILLSVGITVQGFPTINIRTFLSSVACYFKHCLSNDYLEFYT